jgi:TRAP-type C4-dicarboxylate transport system substrate-binding protein
LKGKKWGIFIVLLVMLMVVSACGHSAAQEKVQTADSKDGVITLKVADSFPTSHNLSQEGAVYWMDRVEELTDGKVKFEYFPAEQLGKADDLLDAAKNKVADVAYVGIGYVSDKLPLSGVGELPNAFDTSVKGTKAYWQVTQDILLEEEFLKNGVRPVYAVTLPPYQVMTTQKPVKELSDMKGIKVRSGGGAQSLTIEKLGGTPVSMPAPEIYTAMERKTIDGTLFALPSVKPYQLEEQLKYITENANLGSFIVSYCINENVWQSLPDDVKAAMTKAGEETMDHLSHYLDELTEKEKKEFMAKGIEFTEVDEDVIQKKTKAVWDDWAEELNNRGLPATKVVDAFREALEE